MNGKPIIIAAVLLAIMTVTALITYLLAKHDLENRRPTAGSPTSAAEVADPESDIIREMLLARSVVERYIRAVTARDEAAAALFTCRKTNGGLLWVSAVGRAITVQRVVSTTIEPVDKSSAVVHVQVEGKPPSPVVLRKVDGTWCVLA